MIKNVPALLWSEKLYQLLVMSGWMMTGLVDLSPFINIALDSIENV